MRCGLVLLATVTLAPAMASASETAAPDVYDDVRADAPIDAHGLVDLYLAHDVANPASHRNELRAFDFRSNEPSIGFARLTLAHRPHRFGFRIDAGFGDTTDALFRSDPASLQHPGIARWSSYVTQAFATIDLPLGRGVQIDAGKFATPVGYEGNESIANWNYSRGLLYDWAEPSLHTGIRATVAPSDRFALSSFLLNGWNTNVLDGNGLRSFALAAMWKPNSVFGITVVDIGGLERDPVRFANRALAFRNLVNASATWNPERHLSFVLTGDYGHDAARGGVDWWGVGGYARVEPTRYFDLAMRAELLADPQGFVTGVAQHVAEVTSTIDAHWIRGSTRFVARLEYRHDQSSATSMAPASTSPRNRQDTLTAALLATF